MLPSVRAVECPRSLRPSSKIRVICSKMSRLIKPVYCYVWLGESCSCLVARVNLKFCYAYFICCGVRKLWPRKIRHADAEVLGLGVIFHTGSQAFKYGSL